MVDKFTEPLLTAGETARHLQIPRSTMYSWLSETAAGAPLVHQVDPIRRGRPSVPFVAVVEAYVLRSLRALGLRKTDIAEAAGAVRRAFRTDYGLATRRIATDGVDIFVEFTESGELARARDGQQPIKEVIRDYLRYIVWDDADEFPKSLRLRQYPRDAPVVIDPRFGWGAPVLERNRVPVESVIGLWEAGESLESVAYEYDLTREQVEAICRAALRAA